MGQMVRTGDREDHAVVIVAFERRGGCDERVDVGDHAGAEGDGGAGEGEHAGGSSGIAVGNADEEGVGGNNDNRDDEGGRGTAGSAAQYVSESEGEHARDSGKGHGVGKVTRRERKDTATQTDQMLVTPSSWGMGLSINDSNVRLSTIVIAVFIALIALAMAVVLR